MKINYSIKEQMDYKDIVLRLQTLGYERQSGSHSHRIFGSRKYSIWNHDRLSSVTISKIKLATKSDDIQITIPASIELILKTLNQNNIEDKL